MNHLIRTFFITWSQKSVHRGTVPFLKLHLTSTCTGWLQRSSAFGVHLWALTPTEIVFHNSFSTTSLPNVKPSAANLCDRIELHPRYARGSEAILHHNVNTIISRRTSLLERTGAVYYEPMQHAVHVPPLHVPEPTQDNEPDVAVEGR